MKSTYYAGLQSIALALIFMPEPVTTVIGVGLLSYARKNAKPQRPTNFRRLTNTFEDHYSYRVNMVRGTAINYQLSPRRHGQLPRAYPSIAKLQDNPQLVKALRERVQGQSARISYSKLEPAGLMRGPRIRDRAALATPQNMSNPKMSSIIT
ncbi:MAG: hypothetical protein FJ023_02085 [Chloroflexi bacterium]|nr:hypothetical protein [Chloroflexota bacterium]